MRYWACILLLTTLSAAAEDVNVVIDATIEQKVGTAIDPLGLEGASMRIVITYDDTIPYSSVYYFNSGGAAYSFTTAVKAIEFGFYNRPSNLPLLVHKYEPGGSDLELTGSVAATSYDDDLYGPGRISTSRIQGNFGGTGLLSYFQSPQIQGLWTQPNLPTIAQWATWSASYYGQNDPFSNWPSITTTDAKYELIYTDPATVTIYDAASLPPLPGTVTPINIDVIPGDANNAVYPNKGGKLPVVLLGGASFDATQIDPATVQFGPAGATPSDAPEIAQVDGLHGDDMTLKFTMGDTGILCNDADVTVAGETYLGEAFEGTDSIDATECEAGGCHAY